MTTTAKPYLSVVATSRNDDHGGALLERMQHFIDGLAEQCDRHSLDAELILVEWNPPATRARLVHALRWPEPGRCAIRIIEVPPAVHQRFAHADRLPLFQMIAKNVGIHRSRGEFILATNIDILFSTELFEFFAQKRLQRNHLYRINRVDVTPDLPADASLEMKLRHCRRNVIRVNGRMGTYTPRSYMLRTRLDPAIRLARRVVGGTADRIWSAMPPNRQRLVKRLAPAALRRRIPVRRVPDIHLNACGDFTLLHRDDWVRLRAYPEWEMFSFHLDSLFCLSAHHSGIKEVELRHPMMIYHLEHAGGWTPEVHLDKSLEQRIDALSVSRITDDRIFEYAREMERERRPIFLNKEDWGLADVDLSEIVVSARNS